MAVLGLRFCARAFSSCGKWGPLFIAVRGPLTIAASLVAEHRLQMRRLSSCGSRAQLLRGMWDPPRPGLEPMCPALAGRFSTTAPPGKPSVYFLNILFFLVCYYKRGLTFSKDIYKTLSSAQSCVDVLSSSPHFLFLDSQQLPNQPPASTLALLQSVLHLAPE